MLMNKHRFALLVALATVGAPLAAHAQRKSPLADAPAISKRFELRQTRFEAGDTNCRWAHIDTATGLTEVERDTDHTDFTRGDACGY